MEGDWMVCTARKMRLSLMTWQELIDLVELKYKIETHHLRLKLSRKNLPEAKRKQRLVRLNDLDERCIPEVTAMIEMKAAYGHGLRMATLTRQPEVHWDDV